MFSSFVMQAVAALMGFTKNAYMPTNRIIRSTTDTTVRTIMRLLALLSSMLFIWLYCARSFLKASMLMLEFFETADLQA